MSSAALAQQATARDAAVTSIDAPITVGECWTNHGRRRRLATSATPARSGRWQTERTRVTLLRDKDNLHRDRGLHPSPEKSSGRRWSATPSTRDRIEISSHVPRSASASISRRTLRARSSTASRSAMDSSTRSGTPSGRDGRDAPKRAGSPNSPFPSRACRSPPARASGGSTSRGTSSGSSRTTGGPRRAWTRVFCRCPKPAGSRTSGD